MIVFLCCLFWFLGAAITICLLPITDLLHDYLTFSYKESLANILKTDVDYDINVAVACLFFWPVIFGLAILYIVLVSLSKLFSNIGDLLLKGTNNEKTIE